MLVTPWIEGKILQDYLEQDNLKQVSEIAKEFFEMITTNIFRPLPVIIKSNVPGELGMEDEDQILDPAWPYL